MKPYYQIEPLNGRYRIIASETNRPIIFESDLPLEIMEDIACAFENRYEEIYKQGFRDGYSHGWTDRANDTFNK